MLILISIILPTNAKINSFFGKYFVPKETMLTANDTSKNATFPIPPPSVNPNENADNSPLYGKNPSNYTNEVIYDPVNDKYVFQNKLGDDVIGTPYYMDFDEYIEYDFDKAMKSYWKQRSKSETAETRSSLIPKLEIGSEIFDRIFGGNTIDIVPRGSAELTLGVRHSFIDNPAFSKKENRNTTFTFNEAINMSVIGQIGDKMKVDIRYDTEAAFDFQNSAKLEYTGQEDEILQKIEAGNVALPLTGTLISGSLGLFGFKTELKFGKLTVTSIFSQKKSESQTIDVEGGAQSKEFDINADDYETNKHFFLSHYFKDQYDDALSILPLIKSPINITRIEVWVTNRSGNFENSRNIIAFTDLGESNSAYIQSDYVNTSSGGGITRLPNNDVNILGDIAMVAPGVRDINQVGSVLMNYQMIGGADYEKIESARLLSPSEYTINSKLGYISLNSALTNDQVLAVAFEYTISDKVYKVGEFSNSAITAPQSLVVKLLKGTSFNPHIKTWSLMMRNIYYLRTYQMTSEDFWLDIMYTNDKTGTEINFLPVGKIDSTRLLSVLNLDNLNSQLNPYPDGVFDYIEDITANSSSGKIIFPVREPFGNYLKKKITGGSSDPNLNKLADEYTFQELYDSTQTVAQQLAEKNKFKLRGRYKSSGGSEIRLNAIDIPRGSVKVTAGAQELIENTHYTVDYNMGIVKIIDPGITESGTPIRISLESNTMFNTITRTLVGTHFNYEFSKDLNVGATILNLTEKPLTTKVNIGEEPISNTIWGLNASYRTDAPFLTKAIDYLPFLETKEMSSITVSGEFAHLIPGHSRAIKKEGNAYIDDFEGSKSSYDYKSYYGWSLASTPADSTMFPEGRRLNDLSYGFNRAKLAWYTINSSFYNSNSPVNSNQLSSHYVRQVFEKEIFPNRDNLDGNYPNAMNALNLVYYPNERGPYNYDVNGIDENGFLLNPRKRWGGVMRKVQTTDFESSNIEYIEFWLMDPFVEDQDNAGGDLYFNLGDVSEDVLKDGRKSFEQGLPTPSNDYPVDTTAWGIVPKIQVISKSFDIGEDARKAQDVGMDGLSSDRERDFFNLPFLSKIAQRFGASSVAYQKALSDPSTDDFQYYLGGEHDSQGSGILDRYKNINGLEGNSPTQESDGIKNTPDVEDINDDYTLSESENYFQYRISIRKEDLEVGKNFITDKIVTHVTFENDERSSVAWYQFRIPVYDYEKKIGFIRDFKSIRFMRLFMYDFSQQTVLRFATLGLVRSEWRKYNASFMQPGEYIVGQLEDTPFQIGAVNIEENSNKTPVNYVLPPDVTRETSPMSPQLRQLNEQAMSLKVLNLQDGDARAVYRNLELDIRKYKVLRMFAHAEAVPNYPDIKDDDLTLFIRLGTDFKNNYYEYELPLKVTSPGYYDHSDSDRELVWPIANNLDLNLEKLQDVKQERNDKLRDGNQDVALTRLYTILDNGRKISVMGNPNLANVKTILIGVRNPKKTSSNSSDDGLEKSGEIWVNELRLSEFDEKGGWAANARVTAKLADFGNLALAGSTSKPGFGAINQKLSELQTDDIYRYDLSSNFELGKFFPERLNIRIPLYMSLSENFANPQYNPLDPDVPFNKALSDPKLSKQYKDSMRNLGQDYTMRKSYNFNNVNVNKASEIPKVYDLANWSVSYGYNEIFQRDVNTVGRRNKNYSGTLFYNYNATPKIVEPFKNVSLFKSKSLQILRDFNFYYLPSQISFMTNMNRQYEETELRNIYNPDLKLPISVRKDFTWIRQYDFKYQISKNLKFEFSATNNSIIDEPEGRLYKDMPGYNEYKEEVWRNIKNFGRNTAYRHNITLSYTIPLNKIPILNWISANAAYSATYDWTAAPLLRTDSIEIGNNLQNANQITINTNLNLTGLYNKIKYIDQVNKKYRGRQQQTQKKEYETVTYKSDDINFREGRNKNINHKLQTIDDINVKVTTKEGTEVKGETKIVDKNRIIFIAEENAERAKVEITGKREKKDKLIQVIFDQTLLVMMSVKNVSIGYSNSGSTLLPGYMPGTKILGMSRYPDRTANSMITPNFPFIIGWQDTCFGDWAMANNLLTNDTNIIQPFVQGINEAWRASAMIEPIKDLRIDLNATHSKMTNKEIYYINKERLNPLERGSFSMTTITFKTAFESIPSEGDLSSNAFKTFSSNRLIIAQRLAQERKSKDPDYNPNLVDEEGFPLGFSKNSQEVIIPAFFAAYTSQNPNKTNLEPVQAVLKALPGWRITYDGLGKFEFFKKYFRTINVVHNYSSNYSIGAYQSRLSNEYYEVIDGINSISNEIGDYYSKYEINGISISEQFSPLISVDVTMNNSLIAKFELRKTRNLNMSLTNLQLTEIKDNGITIGTGYRFKEVPITIKVLGKQHSYKSDLNLRLDFTYKNQISVIRKLEEDLNQIIAGATPFSFKATADYVLNERFTMRVFYNHILNKPKVSQQFKTLNIECGFTLKFLIA